MLLIFFHIVEKKICSGFISKINSNCQRQIIILIIPNKEKEVWHSLAVKKLSTLVRGITLQDNIEDFRCLNCLHSLRRENKVKSHEKVCKN